MRAYVVWKVQVNSERGQMRFSGVVGFLGFFQWGTFGQDRLLGLSKQSGAASMAPGFPREQEKERPGVIHSTR